MDTPHPSKREKGPMHLPGASLIFMVSFIYGVSDEVRTVSGWVDEFYPSDPPEK